MKMNFDYVRRAGRNIRTHGNGFIQIDLLGRPGERVHVFGHPSIPRQCAPTPVHDHRFGFISTILSGCLINVDWVLWEDDAARATHHVCVYPPPPPGSEDTKLELTDTRGHLSRMETRALQAGERYAVSPGCLHETFANEATVTHMRKTAELKGYQPRVLCRIGQEPDNSFDRYEMLTEHAMWEIVEEAFELGGL